MEFVEVHAIERVMIKEAVDLESPDVTIVEAF